MESFQPVVAETSASASNSHLIGRRGSSRSSTGKARRLNTMARYSLTLALLLPNAEGRGDGERFHRRPPGKHYGRPRRDLQRMRRVPSFAAGGGGVEERTDAGASGSRIEGERDSLRRRLDEEYDDFEGEKGEGSMSMNSIMWEIDTHSIMWKIDTQSETTTQAPPAEEKDVVTMPTAPTTTTPSEEDETGDFTWLGPMSMTNWANTPLEQPTEEIESDVEIPPVVSTDMSYVSDLESEYDFSDYDASTIVLDTVVPTDDPTSSPSYEPTVPWPTYHPTPVTEKPSDEPSKSPVTAKPSNEPSKSPVTDKPSDEPSKSPVTIKPSDEPSKSPVTAKPSDEPSKSPVTAKPSDEPSNEPTISEITSPTRKPSANASLILDIPTTPAPTPKPTTPAPTPEPTTPAPTLPPTPPPTLPPTPPPTPAPTMHPFTDSDFRTAFQQCVDPNGSCQYRDTAIGDWDVSRVTDFSDLFIDTSSCSIIAGAESFNEPINWDTGSATTMTRMFWGASAFNQQLPETFDTSAVTDVSTYLCCVRLDGNQILISCSNQTCYQMQDMFYNAAAFNQDLCHFGDNFDQNWLLLSMFSNSGCDSTITPSGAAGPWCAETCPQS
ncbi:hypothetical protein THAOC_31617 [Thalassiosira oceanica]|uniref:Uncharacterized protein n=1 Tax=Thalassiosira oceanica TaxID=159749 RepID=K0R8U9_THAOC|nr:hypothetical protein THAOC_31617 [Thalassiosira oceanica]|eukprot:EJK49505.1 hypothetical protein THAOC_31617 [Thalassiosira oceanica]